MPTVRRCEQTIARPSAVRGVSFLSGLDVEVVFRPAEAGTGVVFVRKDLPDRPSVPAHVRHVVPRQRRTAIQRGEAVVEMVEHILAALAGLRIDNCLVEIDGPETPGCDGSSQAFVEALTSSGTRTQDRPREVLTIGQPLTVREGPSVLTAYPGSDANLVLSYHLDYGAHTAIGSQSRFVELTPERFRDELAPSRTFLTEAEAQSLRAAGIGRRTSERDLLIFGPDGPINNDLRYTDECVRHKLLDMVGDLALLGKDLVGHVVAHRSGHQLNAEMVRALLRASEEQAASTPSHAPAPLGVPEIMRLLPHRYPFLLIDRVTLMEPPRRLVALKNVSCNEPFFPGHWPGRPIMPGVLILEAMAQAAGVLIAQAVDPRTHVALLASIDGVKLRRPVVPGDQLRLEVEGGRTKGRMVDVSATAWVEDQIVAEARIRFAITPTEQAA
jgi:UDP-3-O-[3-hydroxymyristoyl] N-acetylglucosamine deacetylase/3-hydroxyacyl-[acyl-carrier-protein] dehydratase